jgi:hypothetical protein
MPKVDKNRKGGARSEGLIFQLTFTTQERGTLYAFHKDLHINKFNSGYWIFWLY